MHFDADPGWLGPKHLNAFRHEPCWQRCRQQVLRQLHCQRPIERVEDWPVLRDELRWPGTNVHLMGAAWPHCSWVRPPATCSVGGREAAQRICRAAIKA